jgi:hypothetical protein
VIVFEDIPDHIRIGMVLLAHAGRHRAQAETAGIVNRRRWFSPVGLATIQQCRLSSNSDYPAVPTFE